MKFLKTRFFSRFWGEKFDMRWNSQCKTKPYNINWKVKKHPIKCCFWRIEHWRKTTCCPIDLFPPPHCVTLTILAFCTLFAVTLNISSKCSHPHLSSGDLPETSPESLLCVVATSDNQLSVERQVEDEEDVSDKVAAAPWSLFPHHLLLLTAVNVYHDSLFTSSVTSPPLWQSPSTTVSTAEACGGQVSNRYGPLKMHGGAIQSLTTEGNVKPLHCPPLTGVV